MTTDLIFGQPPLGQPAELVFGGESDGGGASSVNVSVSGSLPKLQFRAGVGEFQSCVIRGELPAMTVSVGARYDSDCQRPVAGIIVASHSVAGASESGARQSHQSADSLAFGVRDKNPARFFEGAFDSAFDVSVGFKKAVAGVAQKQAQANKTPTHQRSLHATAANTAKGRVGSAHSDATRAGQSRSARFQGARGAGFSGSSQFQVMLRSERREQDSHWQPGSKLGLSGTWGHSPALKWLFGAVAKHEEAVPTNGGSNPKPPPPPPNEDLCYVPDPNLVFSATWGNDTGLVFICERHNTDPEIPGGTVVVPIRSVYIVLNQVTLKRVQGNVVLPALALSLSIDTDSWTWAFNASLPAQALPDVEPVDGQPVELEASVNGTLYRVLVEQISRERSFGSSGIRISGRGKSALLASPYAPVMSFANSAQRTAQQLMADVLTINGVSLGWDIDWGLTDWFIPAGTFAVQGSRIEALNTIASAAGAYIQPHPTLDRFSVRLRYPVAPWNWNTVIPDYEIPSAVMTRESIEWVNKPGYNRVFVSGQQNGILGQVTKAGTAGDLVAPMVTDSLITHADAARQRGLSVLGDTGRQGRLTLSLPVLAETGVITPGKFVRYTDNGVTRIGLTRAVSVDASGSSTNLRQNITVETHA